MKKLKLRENVKNIIGVILFYLLIIGGVILINYRLETINSHEEVINIHE